MIQIINKEKRKAELKSNKKNPHYFVLGSEEKIRALESIQRIDEDGLLYSMDCDFRYTSLSAKSIFSSLKKMRQRGCSAFSIENEDGDIITGRNFDFDHVDENDKATGLTVMVKCGVEGKYKSIAFSDMLILNEAGMKFKTGSLDDGKTDTSMALLLPWLSMDGINEKGLSVSILALDVKEGEKAVDQNVAGKKKIVITEMLRLMLDNCADVVEAISIARNYNLVNILGNDYHLFATDSMGRKVVMEWINNRLVVTSTKIVTNFYVSKEDAKDCIKDGRCKEKWLGPADTKEKYKYGYGHGYERFKTMAKALDEKDRLTNKDAFELLDSVSQKYDPSNKCTSASETIYSVVYNNTKRTAKILLGGKCKTYSFILN